MKCLDLVKSSPRSRVMLPAMNWDLLNCAMRWHNLRDHDAPSFLRADLDGLQLRRADTQTLTR